MTHETTAPVQSLHDQIMHLPCTPPKDANVNQMIAYKSGHRDARHAAAELAAAYEADAQRAAPVAVSAAAPTPPAQQSQLAGAFLLVTPEQVEKHATTAWECPPQSRVILVSSLERLHKKNAANLPTAPGDTAAPEQAEQQPVAWARQCDLDGPDDVLFVSRYEHQKSGYSVALYTAAPIAQAEQDAVKVPRAQFERWHQRLRGENYDIWSEMRSLLGGDA